jgi:hypothetical protein
MWIAAAFFFGGSNAAQPETETAVKAAIAAVEASLRNAMHQLLDQG